MLLGALGIRLFLWLGKPVPYPASVSIAEALTRVEVTSDVAGGDGFQLTFSVKPTMTGEYDLLRQGRLEPWTRAIVGVLLGTTPKVLIDGVITHHELNPGDPGGSTTLTVTGCDLTTLLNQQEKTKKYDNQPDSLIVTQILFQYLAYGLVPTVTPTTDVPLSLQRTPWQRETDLRCIERLAAQNGYVFYIEPVTFGVNKAYFGPDVRLSLPQPALTLNMGSASNTSSLRFTHDAGMPVSASGRFFVPGTQTALPIPELPSLALPPMALMPTPAKRKTILRDAAKKDLAQALQAVSAARLGTRDPVTGTGELDAARYGNVLRTRRMVGVRGAGRSYDGFYYVTRVTHNIARGTYTQSFSLCREGLQSLTPVVPT